MIISEALRLGSRLDSERLLLHYLNQTESSWLYAHAEEELKPAEKEQFMAGLEKRQTGYPLAYILGFTEFYGRRFIVTPDVLIPRPETEELVNEAITAIKGLYGLLKRPLHVADIGTGSGCIAITLALECGDIIEKIYATDISEKALAVAKQNTELFFPLLTRGGVGVVVFTHGSLLADINPSEIDLIISNPPYIASAELDLSPTPDTIGLKFEPRSALDGGVDGQDVINRLIKLSRPLLIEATGGVIKKFNF